MVGLRDPSFLELSHVESAFVLIKSCLNCSTQEMGIITSSNDLTMNYGLKVEITPQSSIKIAHFSSVSSGLVQEVRD